MLGFSINRISLIGKDHVKFIKFMSEVSIKKYTAVFLLISAILSLIKGFHYHVIEQRNEFDDQNYPILFYRIPFINLSLAKVVDAFNALADLSNYLVFIIIQLQMMK